VVSMAPMWTLAISAVLVITQVIVCRRPSIRVSC